MATLNDVLDKAIRTNLSRDQKNFYGLNEEFENTKSDNMSDFSIKAFDIISDALSGAEYISLDEIDLRIKRLDNLKKYVRAAKVGETEEKIVSEAINKTQTALTKQKKWKKARFNKANSAISNSAIDIGALFIAMSGDPLVGLGVKVVGDLLSGRKERKMQAVQGRKDSLRQDAEVFKNNSDSSDSSDTSNSDSDIDDIAPGPLVRDSALPVGSTQDGSLVTLLQDIFSYTKTMSDDVKLLVWEAKDTAKHRRSTGLDSVESDREGGRGPMSGLYTPNARKQKISGNMAGEAGGADFDWGQVVDVVQTAAILSGGTLVAGAARFGLTGMVGAAILGTAVNGILGYLKAEEWGVSKPAGYIGGILGGGFDDKLTNTFVQAGLWATLGARAGAGGGPGGILLGGLLGGAIGGIMGYIGGENVALFVEDLGGFVMESAGKIFSFLWDGIGTIFSWVKDAVSGILKYLPGYDDLMKQFDAAYKKILQVKENFDTGVTIVKKNAVDSKNNFFEGLDIIGEIGTLVGKDFKSGVNVGVGAVKQGVQAVKNFDQSLVTPEGQKLAKLDRTMPGGETWPMLVRNKIQSMFQPQEEQKDTLGSVSSKYETGGRGADVISSGTGDHGGKSYGTYQLSSAMGQVDAFLKSSGYADRFAGLKVGSPKFDMKWKVLAKSDKNFGDAQHAYIAKTHYEPQMDKLKAKGIDLSGKGRAVQEAVFSTSVQHGAGTKVISNALNKKDIALMSDSDIVSAIQDHKARNVETSFPSSSQAIRDSVSKRIQNEKRDLLKVASADVSKTTAQLQTAQEQVQMSANNTTIIDASVKNNVSAGTSRGGSTQIDMDVSTRGATAIMAG